MKVALRISYDGTPFVGWQAQRNGVAIQDLVSRAVSQLTGETIVVHGASRTDAGVHAHAQVAHFTIESSLPLTAFTHGLHRLLPPEISVRDAVIVPDTFDAQRHATGKWYRYLIGECATTPLWLRHRAWWRRERLHVRHMQRAARTLVGTHDFQSFAASNHARTSTERTVTSLRIHTMSLATAWPLWPLPAGRMLCIDIHGTGFLKQMVRNIVGTLVEIGHGQRDVSSIKKTLAARDRRHCGVCAPACGLYLMEVEYKKANAPRDDSRGAFVNNR